MAISNFNMRFDADTKKQLDSVLATYGLTTPQAFKLFANQVIKTKKVPLSFDYADDMIEDLEVEVMDTSDWGEDFQKMTEYNTQKLRNLIAKGKV